MTLSTLAGGAREHRANVAALLEVPRGPAESAFARSTIGLGWTPRYSNPGWIFTRNEGSPVRVRASASRRSPANTGFLGRTTIRYGRDGRSTRLRRVHGARRGRSRQTRPARARRLGRPSRRRHRPRRGLCRIRRHSPSRRRRRRHRWHRRKRSVGRRAASQHRIRPTRPADPVGEGDDQAEASEKPDTCPNKFCRDDSKLGWPADKGHPAPRRRPSAHSASSPLV